MTDSHLHESPLDRPAYLGCGQQIRPINSVLEEMFETQRVSLPDGSQRALGGGVSKAEACLLYELVRRVQAHYTVEIGLAYGVSALAICQAVRDNGGAACHAVDPAQTSGSGGGGLWALERAGLSDLLTFYEAPDYVALPEMLKQGIGVDLAFVDGWHTFDYALLDFFYIDKMLRPGGLVAFHDYGMPAIAKVVEFALTHRHYRALPCQPRLETHPREELLKRYRRARHLVVRGRILQAMRLPFLWHSNFIALEKIDSFEPTFYFFRRF